jgi:hypothetical protein
MSRRPDHSFRYTALNMVSLCLYAVTSTAFACSGCCVPPCWCLVTMGLTAMVWILLTHWKKNYLMDGGLSISSRHDVTVTLEVSTELDFLTGARTEGHMALPRLDWVALAYGHPRPS